MHMDKANCFASVEMQISHGLGNVNFQRFALAASQEFYNPFCPGGVRQTEFGNATIVFR